MGLGINLADWFYLLLSFGIVLALLLATLYVLKKINQTTISGGSKRGIKLVQSISLGGRHRVVWIKVQGRELILGVTVQQITLLAEWKSDKIEDGAELDEFQKPPEKELLGSQFSRFKKIFMEHKQK
tara:strand:+ start:9 stop:389 length:381 start_codon:yes stop_codon:yes gene_type:complete